MLTEHGYDDTEKVLTRDQWDVATTEQRSGFIAEGYSVLPPESVENVSFAIKELVRLRLVKAKLRAALDYLALSTSPGGQWQNQEICSFVRAIIAESKGE
ncbi:MAG: hypothetical protein NUV63_12090 [Gallionella sp.]|nr:hypothetical protein [Gallionella sp.]